MSTMTERQQAAWPVYVAEAQPHVTSGTVHLDPDSYWWQITYADEVRPGRGHDMSATWTDGEHWVQILLDVYGYGSVAVAEMSLIHNSADDECPCDLCAAERQEDGGDES